MKVQPMHHLQDLHAPTPTLLTVTSITSHSIVVTWQLDTSIIPITDYMVRVIIAATGQVACLLRGIFVS